MPVDGQMSMAAAQRQMDEAARRKGYRSHADMMKLTAPQKPKADVYFEGAEATTAENLRRAYEMGDRAGLFQTTTRVRDPGTISAPEVIARQTDAPMQTVAHDAGAIERGTVERVAAPDKVAVPFLRDAARVAAAARGAPVAEVGAAEIAPATMTRQTVVGQAEDTSKAAALLEGAALGNAPSKAEAQLRMGADKLSKKQRALAASAKGSERRGAKRAALLAIGEQGAELNQQSAALRADEMAKGREAYAQYSQQAQKLRQDALSLQAQIDAAAARGDADAVNRMKSEQAQLYQRAAEANAQAKNVATESDADRRQRAAEANAAAENSRDSERAGMEFRAREGDITRGIAVAEGNAGRSTTVSMADAAAANRRAEDLVRRQDETDQQYAARIMAWQEANAQRDQQAQTTNAGNSLQGQTVTAQLGQRADEGNAGIEQQDQQIRQQGQSASLGAAGIAAGQQTDVAGAKLGVARQQYAQDKARRDAFGNFLLQTGLKVAGTAIGGATGGPAGAAAGSAVGSKVGDALTDDEAEEFGNELPTTSDRRAKTDVEPVDPKAAVRLADAYTRAVSTFRYKEGDGETTAGGMAQELRKDPLGKKFVRDDGEALRVDYNGLNAVVLAGLGAKMDAIAARTSKERRV